MLSVLSDESEPPTSSLITTVPSLTLSPLLMRTSFTVPAWLDGTSIVALSVSSVIKPSSFSMVSPTATSTSITSTSPSSPISGTATSITLPPEDLAESDVDSDSSLGDSFEDDSLSDSASAELLASESLASESSASELFSSESALVLISPIMSPSLILSPTATDRLTISPSNGAGMSIDALSLSTVTIPSSASNVSPTETHSSITSTSSPPTSGTTIF